MKIVGSDFFDNEAIKAWNSYQENKKQEQYKRLVDMIYTIKWLHMDEIINKEEYKKIRDILENHLTD